MKDASPICKTEIIKSVFVGARVLKGYRSFRESQIWIEYFLAYFWWLVNKPPHLF